MNIHWAHCPVCGTGHSTTTPGQPCSAQCRARQRQAEALGRPTPTADPKYSAGNPGRRGTDKGPGPVPKKKGCPIVLLPPAIGIAAAILSLHRRSRR